MAGGRYHCLRRVEELDELVTAEEEVELLLVVHVNLGEASQDRDIQIVTRTIFRMGEVPSDKSRARDE